MPDLIKCFDFILPNALPDFSNSKSNYPYITSSGSIYSFHLFESSKESNIHWHLTILHHSYPKFDWISDLLNDFIYNYPDCTEQEKFHYFTDTVGLPIVHDGIWDISNNARCKTEQVGFVGLQNFSDDTIVGIQVRECFVKEEHRQSKIAQNAYHFISSQFGLLLSDNRQTKDAMRLWNSALPNMGQVRGYDLKEKTYLGSLDGSPNHKNVFWGNESTQKDYKPIAISLDDEPPYSNIVDINESKLHIVIIFEQV